MKMDCWESLFIHIFQQQDLLIEEQKVNELNELYSLGNVTIQYSDYTTKFNLYVQFSSRHICIGNTNIG